MYSNVEILNLVFRGVEVKKSEIRLKSENLHPCTLSPWLVWTSYGLTPVLPVLGAPSTSTQDPTPLEPPRGPLIGGSSCRVSLLRNQ